MSETTSSANYTEEQEIYLYETFIQTMSLGKTKKKFQKKFPNCVAPKKSMIDNIVKKFGESISNANKPKTRKKRQDVQEYRISEVEDLKRGDPIARVHFCEWFFKSLNEGLLDSQFIFFTGESWFHLSGYVYTQNTYCWLSQEPQIPLTQPKDDKKVGVWCAVSAKRIVGPIFYEETLSADDYKTSILDKFLEGLTEEERSKGWFQLDSEAVNANEDSMDKLGEVFSDRVIGAGLWPARSPDLTPCQFYLWEKLINKIYEVKPDTMDDLKRIIRQEIENVELSELQKVHQNMVSRYHLCISQKGETFEYLL